MELNKKYYRAELSRLDFENEEKARQKINDWTSRQTDGKIPELLSKGHISARTSLVLTNAVYLKAAWESAFDKELTEEAEFHVNSATRRKVSMMNATFIAPYFESPEFQLVKLPYKGKQLSLLIVLPAKGRRLPEVLSKMTAEALSAAIGKLKDQYVQIGLPRFKAETSLMMKETLVEMGMIDAFSDVKANFAGMSPEFQFIDKVVHKAIVEVDEVGTEAAAATAVLMLPFSSQRPKMFPFRADRPFAFFIYDEATTSILFAGRLVDPR